MRVIARCILFTSAAATALGIVSSNPKTFIVAFLTFWYITTQDKGASPSLDFAGNKKITRP